jgi:hypothetical protein
MAVGVLTGEQPRLGFGGTIPFPQQLQQLAGEHHVTILLPLALSDTDRHALAIDVSGFEGDGLGDAQSSGVAHGEDGAGFVGRDAAEELANLLGTEDHWQRLWSLWRWDESLDVPLLLEGDAVQEAQGRDGDAYRAGAEPLVIGQIDLVRTDLLGSEEFW